jgi:hypothetical protein
MLTELAAFLAVSALVIVTPGPDTLLTIRNTLSGGRRAGVFTAIGSRRDRPAGRSRRARGSQRSLSPRSRRSEP